MVSSRDAAELGMSRRISRRDFINGVAVAVAASRQAGGAAARAQPSLFFPEAAPDYYPPALTGLRGNHLGSFEVAHAARDGEYARFSQADVEDPELYDLVIVGGGLSGLAAAYFFRGIFGPASKILILDNHDDFGGHAKRNEFRHEGRLFIGYGGTMSIETPFPYSYVSRALIRELGIEVERESEVTDRGLYRRHGLTAGMFFAWTSFQKLGVSSVGAPGMYHSFLTLDTPVSIGGYRCSESPEEPIIIHMTRYANRPGLPRREQNRAGMRELLATPFEQIELEIRRQLERILGAGGFDPARDILGITANRWPHGYAYTYDSLGDPDLPAQERPHVIGRQPFGRIAIANSDAGAAAFTNTAIDEAHRAVQDLLQQRGMI